MRIPGELQHNVLDILDAYWEGIHRFPPSEDPEVASHPGTVFARPNYPKKHINYKPPPEHYEPPPTPNLVNMQARRRLQQWRDAIFEDGRNYANGMSWAAIGFAQPSYSGIGKTRKQRQALSLMLLVDRSWCRATLAYTWSTAELGSILGQIRRGNGLEKVIELGAILDVLTSKQIYLRWMFYAQHVKILHLQRALTCRDRWTLFWIIRTPRKQHAEIELQQLNTIISPGTLSTEDKALICHLIPTAKRHEVV